MISLIECDKSSHILITHPLLYDIFFIFGQTSHSKSTMLYEEMRHILPDKANYINHNKIHNYLIILIIIKIPTKSHIEEIITSPALRPDHRRAHII